MSRCWLGILFRLFPGIISVWLKPSFEGCFLLFNTSKKVDNLAKWVLLDDQNGPFLQYVRIYRGVSGNPRRNSMPRMPWTPEYLELDWGIEGGEILGSARYGHINSDRTRTTSSRMNANATVAKDINTRFVHAPEE
jgi:hypothetical protein